MVSVGVVAEGKYLARDGVKDPGEIFRREIEQNLWIRTTSPQARRSGLIT
jgi:hypothetical protein